jgi:hypothetical protein
VDPSRVLAAKLPLIDIISGWWSGEFTYLLYSLEITLNVGGNELRYNVSLHVPNHQRKAVPISCRPAPVPIRLPQYINIDPSEPSTAVM